MKKSLLAFSTLIILSILFYPQAEVISNTTGSSGGMSGAPGDNTCVQCHSTFGLNTGTALVSIISTIPASGFVPGNTYTITASAAQTGISKYGFEVHEALGSILITNPTTTQHLGFGSNRITHQAAGTTVIINNISWSFDWVAPATGSGNVTFYGAFVAANNATGNNNDHVYTTNLMVSEFLPVPGCMDALAINYDPLATVDDGSCNYSPVGNLFISEYAEGTSFNKYIEIYNGTGSSVDLSDYDIWKITNGGNWPGSSLSLTGILANNEVYIICSSNSNVNDTILNVADTVWGGANWNGNDAVGLAKNGVLIDVVGNGVDPGIAWDVAGVVEATKEHTLVRKCSVTQGDTNWIASAGVDSLTSQWLVYPQDYWIDINQHSGFCGCTDPLACNYDSLANTDDGSCAYDVVWQQNEIICNGDSVMVGSNIYYLSGSYTDSLSTIYGCDSTVYTTLTVNSSTDFQQSITLCEGDSLVVGSNIYYDTGNYSDTLTTISGCDSIIFSDLDFFQPTPLIIQSEPNSPEICLGDTILLEASPGFVSYAWTNGMTEQIIYDNPTTDTWYMVEAVDANGCIVKEDINVYVDSCITGVNEIYESNKKLLKITDILGRESKPTPNVSLFYRYNDGTVEKRIIVE